MILNIYVKTEKPVVSMLRLVKTWRMNFEVKCRLRIVMTVKGLEAEKGLIL